MKNYRREFSSYTTEDDKVQLAVLTTQKTSVPDYQAAMTKLGFSLARQFVAQQKVEKQPVLVVSTAEDADFLTQGYLNYLEQSGLECKVAVFWNHHYSTNGKSVAPIVQSYLEEGYNICKEVIILKSIISGSCVVRTNLIALLEQLGEHNISKITVAAPVMYKDSAKSLRKEFPDVIGNKFEFHTFATDYERTESGEVLLGIGGDVYPHLGLEGQPAKIRGGYTPNLVRQKIFG